MSVYTKLNQAREQFHTLALVKTGLNKFAGYKYFELGDFIIPALRVFKENDLCAYISFGVDLATMTIVEVDSGEIFTITSPMSTAALKGCHEVQNLGAVQTYLRRYLWVAALEIVEHDALDATTGQTRGPKIGARDGIGDDLPEDWKIYLKDLAFEVSTHFNAGNVSEALDVVQKAGLEDDQIIFFEDKLDSKVRNGLRNARKPK
jgi:ERF superfamily